MKENALRSNTVFKIVNHTKLKRWSEKEKIQIRMYLLANMGPNEKMSWQDVGAFMQNRTSTQVRTHVQKFRTKTIKLLKEVDGMKEKIASK